MSAGQPEHPAATAHPRRWRLGAVLLVLLGGLAGLLASTQPWFTVALHDSDGALAVAGASALPVLAPLSLAALALGAALSIAGRWLTYAIGLLTLVVGATLVSLAAPIAFGAPQSAVAAVVTEATGIAGDHAVAELIDSITSVGWGYAAVVGGIATTVAGVLILLTAHRWQLTGRRYRAADTRSVTNSDAEPGQPPRTVDSFDAWDGLSRGDDPTR